MFTIWTNNDFEVALSFQKFEFSRKITKQITFERKIQEIWVY